MTSPGRGQMAGLRRRSGCSHLQRRATIVPVPSFLRHLLVASNEAWACSSLDGGHQKFSESKKRELAACAGSSRLTRHAAAVAACSRRVGQIGVQQDEGAFCKGGRWWPCRLHMFVGLMCLAQMTGTQWMQQVQCHDTFHHIWGWKPGYETNTCQLQWPANWVLTLLVLRPAALHVILLVQRQRLAGRQLLQCMGSSASAMVGTCCTRVDGWREAHPTAVPHACLTDLRSAHASPAAPGPASSCGTAPRALSDRAPAPLAARGSQGWRWPAWLPCRRSPPPGPAASGCRVRLCCNPLALSTWMSNTASLASGMGLEGDEAGLQVGVAEVLCPDLQPNRFVRSPHVKCTWLHAGLLSDRCMGPQHCHQRRAAIHSSCHSAPYVT